MDSRGFNSIPNFSVYLRVNIPNITLHVNRKKLCSCKLDTTPRDNVNRQGAPALYDDALRPATSATSRGRQSKPAQQAAQGGQCLVDDCQHPIFCPHFQLRTDQRKPSLVPKTITQDACCWVAGLQLPHASDAP